MSLFKRSVQGLDRFQQRHRVLGFPFAVRQKYAEDQGGYLAASVTYYAFFSIFPLLLVLVTLLGYALEGDPDLQRRVLDSALADFPVIGPQLEDNVHSLRGSIAALAVGIGVALWAGTGVALALENALDHIWGIPIRRRINPLFARLRALLWIAVLGGITLVGTVLASASAVASYGPAVRLAALARLVRDQPARLHRGLPRPHQPQPFVARRIAGCARGGDRRGRCCRRAAATSSTTSYATRRAPTASSRS